MSTMNKKDSVADLTVIGDFTYFDDGERATCLCVVIPWSDGQQIMTEEYPIQHQFRDDHAWPWAGEEDKPTVSHSFHFKGKWDGVVLNGEVQDL